MASQPPPQKPFFWLDESQLQKIAQAEATRRQRRAWTSLIVGLGLVVFAIVGLFSPPTYTAGGYYDTSGNLVGRLALTLGASCILGALWGLRVFSIFPAAGRAVGRILARPSGITWFRVGVILSILLGAAIIAASIYWRPRQ
jgi:hypothetical protein